MKALVILSGGQGKQLMSTQIVRELVLSNKYDQVIAVNHYIWWLQELELEFKKQGIRSFKALGFQQLGTMMPSIIGNSKDWVILKDNVYDNSDFALRRANFYEVLREHWGLDKKNDYNENGSNLTPKVAVDDSILPPGTVDTVNKIVKQYNKIVLVCFRGGMSVMPGPDGKRNVPQETGLLRSYPIEDAEELVSKLNNDGYSVIQVKLKEEPLVKGCIELDQEYSMLFWAALAKKSEGVITIDSCLMHAAIDTAPKMVVIWRETQPMQFGYSKAINLLPSNYVPSAPLLSGFPDSPICDAASPDEVFKAFTV